MGLKTVQHNNFWAFLYFSSTFYRDRVFSVATEFALMQQKNFSRQSFSVTTENFVATKFLYCNRKLCRNRVFSVATEFSLL